jgi:hypothetical protein
MNSFTMLINQTFFLSNKMMYFQKNFYMIISLDIHNVFDYYFDIVTC